MKISREMLQYVEDDDNSDFGGYWENTGKAEDGWKLWDCNKKEIDYWVCCDADDESIEGSNKGGEYYFKEIKFRTFRVYFRRHFGTRKLIFLK